MEALCDHFLFAFIAFVSETSRSSIVPVLPLELNRRGLSSIHSGLSFRWVPSFSSLSIGLAFGPLLFKAYVLPNTNRLVTAQLGILLNAVSFLLLAISKPFSSDLVFLVFTYAGRICGGAGDSITVSCLFMMASTYSATTSRLVAITFGSSLADAVGPLYGGLLFPVLGYSGIFLLQMGLVLIGALSSFYFLKY